MAKRDRTFSEGRGKKKREKIELVAAAKQGFVPHGAFAAQRANALCGTIRAITFLFSFPESLSQVGKKKERKKKASERITVCQQLSVRGGSAYLKFSCGVPLAKSKVD